MFKKPKITLRKGFDFSKPYQVLVGPKNAMVPMVLTGYTIESHIRDESFSPVVLKEFTITVTNELEGRFELSLDKEDIEDLPIGTHVFDVKFTNPSGKTDKPYFGGDVAVVYGVTR